MVRVALRRPITVLVLFIGLLLFSILAIKTIAIDIFPRLNLPTIYVIESYGGMSPQQMESQPKFIVQPAPMGSLEVIQVLSQHSSVGLGLELSSRGLMSSLCHLTSRPGLFVTFSMQAWRALFKFPFRIAAEWDSVIATVHI